MPARVVREVSETTKESISLIPAAKLMLSILLMVTRLRFSTAVNSGKLATVKASRISRVRVSEMLARTGAAMLLRVVMLVAVREPWIDSTPLRVAVARPVERMISPLKTAQPAMASRSDWEVAVTELEQTSLEELELEAAVCK